jgi:hypothetical protein
MVEAVQDLEHVAAGVVGLETNVNLVKYVACMGLGGAIVRTFISAFSQLFS